MTKTDENILNHQNCVRLQYTFSKIVVDEPGNSNVIPAYDRVIGLRTTTKRRLTSDGQFHLTAELGEQQRFLLVVGAFHVLDVRPFTVTGFPLGHNTGRQRRPATIGDFEN